MCTHYFDDYCIVEPQDTAACAQRHLRELHDLVGFPFATRKQVDVTSIFVFLGVQHDLSGASGGHVEMSVTQKRLDSITTRIAEILHDRRLPGAAAASLCGKLQFILSWAFGRLGRACMQPLFQHEGPELSSGLVASLTFLAEVLPHLPPHRVELVPRKVPPILVWSDGASEGEGTLNSIGFLVAVPRPGATRPAAGGWTAEALASAYDFHHGAAAVDSDLMRRLLRRSQQIGQVELVGAIAPYLSLPQLFAGQRVIHWIDNTSALAALSKGYSGVPDSAHLVHVFHAWAACSGTMVWFEYVMSEANPADEPSRDLRLAASAWRLRAGPVSSPAPCAQPPLQRLSDPAGWAREAAAVAH